MKTQTPKTLYTISLRVIYSLMILSVLLAGVGIMPARAASPDTISGNAGVAGATITWNGSGSSSDGSTTTDASGNYSFQVTYSWYWSGTVTPSKAGYTFSPSSRTYNFLTSDQTNQNYTATPATYTISGSTGSAGGGATITYTGGSTTANSSGSYSFTVTYGWSGTVTPSKNGYTFSPVDRSYTNVTSNQSSQNYTATLSGNTISGNAGVASATITYTGGSTTANSSGDYSFVVSPGWSGTVTPSRTGFAFWPASRTYTNVTAGETAQNYTARPTQFTFGSYGDSHNETYFNTTADQLASLNPALVLGIGDIEDQGFSATEMSSAVSPLKSENLFNKTFLVRGNHDDKIDGSATAWESYFETSPNIPTRPAYVTNKVSLDSSSDNLIYSFDYGNSIFIGLDVPGDVGGAGGAQLLTDAQIEFLDARLTYAESAGLTHAFIYFHGPEYCVELNHCTSATRNDSSSTPPALMTVINNHPIVSATFHGHEHVLAWTHMDNTRVSSLTRSYEQFVTSPAGASSYSADIFPDRVDAAYTDLGNGEEGFATINVNGLSFTVNFYKTGETAPILGWSHTFSKTNISPIISDITDKTTNEDLATGPISFTVSDTELASANLTVTATSSDLTLVPAGNISLGGSGADRTINITPAANESGTATITVSVNDGNVTVDDTFVLTVSAVNDAPVADSQSVSMPWNTSTNIVLTGSDVEGNSLTFDIVDNPAHGSLSGSGANRQYAPTAGYSGTDSFTFKVYDGTVDSAPAMVSILVNAYTISGNAGVAGATLSYSDGTPKTVTADGSGVYSFQVPTGWSGMVTPSKAGYTFSPESMSYANVLADQTAQNYSTNGVMITISGNAGAAGATLSYTDGTPKTATADSSGLYSLEVSYNWSGTVTPSKTGFGFLPASRTYTNLTVNQDSQDYTTTTARVYYVDKTNPACTDTGQVGSMAVPFCTISRGAYLAMPGQIVQVLHGTYAETIYPERSGTEGNPISYLADPGVTVTGQPGTSTISYYAFGLGARNYIVIDGFNITNTSNKGIYVDASNHVTITNNHVSYAGASSLNHPYEQGIYLRNTSYSTISGNTTDHNTCIGIRVVGGNHNLISNNISTENFSLVETDAAGIELTGSSYNTVINNLVYSNEDSGINVYYWDGNGGSTNNLILGNLSYENGDHGIDSYQSPNNTFIGNTVQGNGTTGMNFEGNTAALGSFGAVVANNIISQNGTTPPSGSWGGNLRFDANSITGSTTDYNLFYRTDATVQIIWNNLNYTSLAAFKTAVSGQEAHGLEGNPLFVNPVAPVRRQTGVPYDGLGIFGNYYTSAGSPAIDSANADAPNQQATDIAGNSRIDDPATPNTGAGTRTYDDRGAYEYLPAGPSLPVVTTQACTNILTTSATGNGTIAATGLPNPTQHGVVWGFTANPTILDNKTVDGLVSAPGAFTSTITDLTPGTLYHVRAYATNDVGTVYGEDVLCTTLLAPTVTTQAVTNLTSATATGNGNVTSLGVPNPTQHGVVWSISANPTTADSKTTDGPVSATGAFTSAITGLTPGTVYHVRAYVTNDAATVYGEDVTFTSLIVPTVTTQAVTNILTTTSTGNGNLTSLGIPNPTQHGVVWATTANPTTANSKTTDGPVSATGAFTSTLTGLTPNTLYHVRAYATNAVGTVYGEEVTFTTLLTPAVTTQAVTDLTTTTATGNGNVTVLGSSNPTEHGVVWSTSLNPTLADNKTADGPITVTGPFTSSITGLTPGTTYHLRAYATNAAGTSYGNDVTFTALIAPTVTTQAVTNITQMTAMANGTLVSLGIPNPTQYGVVWDPAINPTIALSTKTEKGPASVTGAFTSNLTGLALGQTYHVRAYATNAVGTAYGEDVVFTTLPSSSTTTTPVTNAGMGADVSGTGTGIWISPGSITAADSSYATVTLSGATSHYLEGTHYGFALPSNATINGIQVTIGRFESGQASGNDVRDSVVSLMKSGTLVGNNKGATSTEWPLANTTATYGANNDLWGTTWTADDINATNFGVALSANSTNNRIASVDSMQIAVTYTISIVSSATSLNCGAGTPIVNYGSSITCVATVIRGSGTFTPTGNVTWASNGSGNFVTSPCVLSGSNGTASCSVSYTPTTVGNGSHLITATYAGDASFYGSNSSQTVTVNKLAASVTPNVASKTYGEVDPTLSGITAGFLPADSVTAVYSRVAGETVAGGPYAISAVLSPVGVLANYNITYNTANFTINKKAASVTPTAANKIYGEADPVLTGTLTGFQPADLVTATYSRIAGETVAGGPYAISAVLSPVGVLANYDITRNTANFTINKKVASVTSTAANKIYGEIDPALTGTLTGFVAVDGVTATYSRVAGETVAGGPYAITAALSPAGVLDNYDLTNTPAALTITQKDASVTPNAASKPLGEADPTLTGTLTGFLPADNVTATYSRAAGETVEGSPYLISATLSPADVLPNYNITTNTANFTITAPLELYTLTINQTGNGTVAKSPDQATYHYGDVVTLTATADPGWSFFNWSSNVIGGTITMHENTTVAAMFVQNEYSLTINKVGNGTVTKSPEKATYHYGDVVTLTATADPGWSFESWSTNVTAGQVTINANTTVTATFTQDEYTLTVNKNGNGSIEKAPDQATYHYGDVVALTATADPGWSFIEWSPALVDGMVTIHGNTTVTALFTPDQYTLTLEQVGNGTVTKAPDQTTYYYGDVVDLTATADAGWTFDHWSANVSAGKVTINANTTVTATFTQDEYTLTIEQTGNGTVTKTPDQATYHYGDVVALTTTPDSGWSFGNWSENVVAGSVTIHGNTTVSATFTQDEYTLTLSTAGNGTVAAVPDQTTYHYGAVVDVTATPDAGWSFGNWSSNVVAGKVTILGNTAVTATFTQNEYTLTIDKTGNGNVTQVPEQSTYHYGDVVALTATPDAGWSFGSWSANVVAGSVTIHANTTVAVTFTQDEYALTLAKIGNGTVAAVPDQTTYHYGDVVTLSATPDLGWSFGGWSANVVAGQVTIAGNTTVTATFTQDEYTLTLTKVGNGLVEIVPDQPSYHYGVSVQLTATPDDGWGFSGWSGDLVSGENQQSITMTGNKNIAATFQVLSLPTVTTQAVTDIAITTVVGNGNVTELGAPIPTQHGFVWSTSADPTLADSKTTEGLVNATGAFTSNITGLTPGTLYHLRAYATNTQGTAYGEDVTFTTLIAPTVTTQAVTDITTTTATGNGNITNLGVPNPTEHGVVWDTSSNPTVLLTTKTAQGVPAGTGAFTSNITGLTAGTLYHIRAYATNAVGTSYGEEVTFTALIAPTVTTQAVTNITATTATGNGNVTALGVPNPTEHGVVWNTAGTPTLADSKTTDGPVSVTGAFTSNITGLALNTTYHVRAYATNSVGTSYGDEVTFTTLLPPAVTTLAVTNITTTTATGNGNITNLGVPNPTQYGVVWDTAINPTIALTTKTALGAPADTGAFTSNITGLTAGTLYHVRAYATNAVGTSYGEDVTFTASLAPTVTTQAVTNITATTATGNGNITVLGVPNPIEHGVVWATTANPTTANSKTTDGPVSATGAFTSVISGLTPGTLYHVRAYATNAVNTVYGTDVTFTTSAATQVTFTTSGSWTVPAGVTSVTVEVWGGGGKGGTRSSGTNSGGGGGGGGAYSMSTIAVTPGNSYAYTVGAGATTTSAGGDSYFVNPSTLLAKGGGSVADNSATGASGGAAASGVGTTKYSGGNGANAGSGYGGGGASSAGTGANGVNATNATGATAPTGGGSGGNGSTGSGNGTAGSTPGGAGGGAYRTYTSTRNGGNGAAGQVRITYYVDIKATTTSVNCGAGTPSVTYGSSLSCVATVTASSGTTSPSGTVSWTTNGAGNIVTSPCTLTGTGGSAACSVTYTPTSVGTGSHLITASYGGATNFLASSGSQVVTVNKKAASVSPNAANKTYGDADPTLSGVLTGFLAGDNVTATYSRVAGETVAGSPYAISATLSPTGVLGNYNITYNTANFTINKLAASVTPNAASKTYGDADPTLSGVLTGFLADDNVTASYSRVAGETAEGSPYAISATLSPTGVLGNYNITYNTANFTITPPIEYTLTINSDHGTVTKLPDQAKYHDGDVVTLTATPEAGWSFGGWSENVVEGKVTIHDNTVVTATFTQNYYTLTIEKTGNGTVTKTPDQPGYHYGDEVTLTATPDLGWSLGSWSANVVDGKVTIHDNTTVTATFTQNEYTLTLVSAHGTVAKDPSEPTYHEGTVVQLTAAADEGWAFANWTGDLISSSNPDFVTIHGNTAITANYTAVNVAPTFASTPITSAAEDALYTYNITATDPNPGDTLAFTASTLPAWLIFTDNGNGSATLTGTPTNAEVGSHDIVLHVSDGTLSAEQPFTIVVTHVNHAPAFTSTPVTTATKGGVYTYTVAITDPDAGDTLVITAPTLPAWLTFTDNHDQTATLTGTPSNADVGINNVSLSLNDGTVNVDQIFTIDVDNTNVGPSFTSTPLTTVDEDAVYTYNLTATDPDAGDTLTITASTLPAWLIFTDHGDGTATLTGTPTNNEVGEHAVVLQITDNTELVSQSFTITVVNTNDAPVLAQPVDQNNAKGAVVSLQLSATDVDAGDTLTYLASGLPGGLSIDPASGLISGTITADPGTYPVTASVEDGHAGTDSQNFNWVVTEATYTLTVNVVGNGTVTKNPDKTAYFNGDEVTLSATPDAGWGFGSWSANVVDGKVIINGNTTVTATFTQNAPSIALVAPVGVLGGWNNTFSWTGLADAEYYHLEVYDAEETMILGQWNTTSICSGLDCAISPAETLSLSKGDFKWRVQSYGSGGYSSWTDFKTFTINAVNLNLISPAGALNSWSNTFRWSGISSAEYYHLELRDASNEALVQDLWFNTNICLGLTCAASPAETQNLVNGDYKWRLQTYGSSGFTSWTDYTTFTLNAPILVLNAPTGTLPSWDKTFHWTGIPSAEYYHTQVYDAATDTLLQEEWYTSGICSGLDCAVSPSETRYLANGDYKWRVQTYGTTGYTPWTAYATFTINYPRVALNVPTGTLSSWDKTFRWTGIPSAEYYHTQVYDAVTDTLVQEEWYTKGICSGLDCAVSPAETRNLANGDYKWRVQTYGTEGYTSWTDFASFTLNKPVVVLNAPAGMLLSWDNSFGWTGLDTAGYYHLQVYDASTDALVQEEWYTSGICTGLACGVSPMETLNLANGDYKWRVQTYGTEGYTLWTAYQTFTLNR